MSNNFIDETKQNPAEPRGRDFQSPAALVKHCCLKKMHAAKIIALLNDYNTAKNTAYLLCIDACFLATAEAISEQFELSEARAKCIIVNRAQTTGAPLDIVDLNDVVTHIQNTLKIKTRAEMGGGYRNKEIPLPTAGGTDE